PGRQHETQVEIVRQAEKGGQQAIDLSVFFRGQRCHLLGLIEAEQQRAPHSGRGVVLVGNVGEEAGQVAEDTGFYFVPRKVEAICGCSIERGDESPLFIAYDALGGTHNAGRREAWVPTQSSPQASAKQRGLPGARWRLDYQGAPGDAFTQLLD